MNAREKILVQASQLIHSKGYNHTSIQDILDSASVTKSNFYYHFHSKEQLAFEMLGERMRQFYAIAIGPSLDNDSLDPLQRIEMFLDRVLAISRSPVGRLGCPFGNLAQEMSAIHESLRLALSDFFLACTERLEQCFEEGKEAGVFKESLPSRQFAEFALAQIQGSYLLRKTHKDSLVMERNVETLRHLIREQSQHY